MIHLSAQVKLVDNETLQVILNEFHLSENLKDILIFQMTTKKFN